MIILTHIYLMRTITLSMLTPMISSFPPKYYFPGEMGMKRGP